MFDRWKASLQTTVGLAGSLDKTFNSNGVVNNDVSGYDDQAVAVLRQLDGKIVVIGVIDDFSNGDFLVMRYNADGTLDVGDDTPANPGFGDVDPNNSGKRKGYTRTTFTGSADGANAAALDSQGRIVVVGRKATRGTDGVISSSDIAIARYTTDGQLDTSFNGGKFTKPFTGYLGSARGIAVEPSGKIVVAGVLTNAAGSSQIVLLRYNANGTPDSGFGTNGGVVTDPSFTPFSDDTNALSLSNDSNDNIVVAGTGSDTTGTFFFVVRFDKFGALDTTFNASGAGATPGYRKIDLTGVGETCFGLDIQNNNKIVLGGKVDNKMAFVRLNASGSLDSLFGTGGVVTVGQPTNPDLYAKCRQILVQPDGKIVGVGAVDITPAKKDGDLGIVRLTTTGAVDESFGNDPDQPGWSTYTRTTGTRELAQDVMFGTTDDGRDFLIVVGFTGAENNNYISNRVLISQWLAEWPFYKEVDFDANGNIIGSDSSLTAT